MPPVAIPVPPRNDAQRFAEYTRSIVRYDPESGHLIRLKSFGGEPAGKIAGCIGLNGYVFVGIGRQRLYAHRVAWLLTYGAWPAGEVDHINGNRSDNRLCNLRSATTQQNQANRRKSAGTVQYKGVYFNKQMKRFQAYIHKDKKTIYLGLYGTPEEAAIAYNSKATELFGSYAKLNTVTYREIQ